MGFAVTGFYSIFIFVLFLLFNFVLVLDRVGYDFGFVLCELSVAPRACSQEGTFCAACKKHLK